MTKPLAAEGAEIRGEHSKRPYQILSFYGDADAIDLPPGNYSIIGLAGDVPEEKAKELMPIISGWSKVLFYNYTASCSDYRDIIDAAFEDAKPSLHSWVRSEGFEVETCLILEKLK